MHVQRFCRSRSPAAAAARHFPRFRWRPQLNDMRSTLRRFSLVCTALFLGLAVPATALAQLVGTAVVESQYRSRGVALTDGKPDLRLGVSYDHPRGVYVGASLIGGETDPGGGRGR